MLDKQFYNMDMEQSILASLMSIEDSYYNVATILDGSDFVANKHEIIYNAIRSLAVSGEPYDVVMVLDHIKASNVSINDYESYLGELLLTAPATKFNLVAYAKRVKELSAIRQTDQLLLATRDQLEAEGSYTDKINNVIDALTKLVTTKTTMRGAETVGDMLKEFKIGRASCRERV